MVELRRGGGACLTHSSHAYYTSSATAFRPDNLFHAARVRFVSKALAYSSVCQHVCCQLSYLKVLSQRGIASKNSEQRDSPNEHHPKVFFGCVIGQDLEDGIQYITNGL